MLLDRYGIRLRLTEIGSNKRTIAHPSPRETLLAGRSDCLFLHRESRGFRNISRNAGRRTCHSGFSPMGVPAGAERVDSPGRNLSRGTRIWRGDWPEAPSCKGVRCSAEGNWRPRYSLSGRIRRVGSHSGRNRPNAAEIVSEAVSAQLFLYVGVAISEDSCAYCWSRASGRF